MNNDDLHMNKIPQQFDYSMQNINNNLSQNDDNCMELLDKLTYDDNTSNVAIYTPTNMGIKDDDKLTQEIRAALDRKDFERIFTLAISQSNNGNKMGNLFTEIIHEIEKNSNKPVDGKIMEKLHNLLGSQPKSISTTTPLRATVAPIRNESIVCSSSSNMSNNTGFRSNKPTKSEPIQDDFLSLISSDCKVQSGTRSLPVTPPISQVPHRPLSSHCVPIRSNNEQRKQQQRQQQQQQECCELDQQAMIQQIPFCNASTGAYGAPQNAQQMQYVPINVNQFAQYQQSMMPPNIFVMPVMNPADPQGAVTQSNQVLAQTGQPGNHNNQISLLLSSPAFFSMPPPNGAQNNNGNSNNQSVATSNHEGIVLSSGGLMTTNSTIPTVRSSSLASSSSSSSSHGSSSCSSSNLPKLLPKPQPQQQHPIMPRTLQYNPVNATGQISALHQIASASSLVSSSSLSSSSGSAHHLSAQQHQNSNNHHQHHQSIQINQSNTFKRPTNRKSSVKSSRPSSSSSGSSSSRSSKSSKKENSNSNSNNMINSNKDNVLMAWEMSSQCGADEDLINLQQHSAAGSAASFITELTSGVSPDQFCLIPTGTVSDGGAFCQASAEAQQQLNQEYDELLDELVTILDVHYAQTMVNEVCYASSIVLERIEPVEQHVASSVVNTDVVPASLAVCQQMRIIPSSNCVVVARQSPSPFIILHDNNNDDIDPTSALLSRSSSSSVVADQQQRVMQLLYAHLGRHSEILTPLLKCLLPPQQQQQQQQSSSGPAHHHQHSQHSRPLSVCTRLSEQDELTEDDLLADISPVKHDPTKLANLDRFLESCQSISPCSSLIQDYEETAFDDDPRSSSMMMAPMLLPFQAQSDENIFTLQDFCCTIAGNSNGGSGQEIASWLRKSKQRNKWTLNGNVIRSSKVLELPSTISERKREKSLRKKVAFKQCGGTVISNGGVVLSKEQKMKRKSRKEKRMVKYLEKIRQIKGENNQLSVDESVEGQQQHGTNQKQEGLVATNSNQAEENQANGGQGGALKMRIRLSQLKVVASTIVRSPDPPPPPLIETKPPKLLKPTRPPPPPPPAPCKQPRRAKIKSNLAIVPPLVQRQAKKHIELNTKRIFCTRKEDRRSSALNNVVGANNSSSSNTSPIKYRKMSPCKMKRVKQQQHSMVAMPPLVPPTLPLPVATTSSNLPEHPPLILKLCTKQRQSESLGLLSSSSSSSSLSDSPSPLSEEQQQQLFQEIASPSQQMSFANNASTTTTGRLKLRLKLSSSSTSSVAVSHQNHCYSASHHHHDILDQDAMQEEPCILPTQSATTAATTAALKGTYEFSPSAPVVTLAPPVHHRPRPQLAALKFSPTHSSSDSDVEGAAHNEISSLLQRQEQRDPLSVVSASTNPIIDNSSNHHHHHHNSFPQLPVPYLVGSDPTVFIDPHEFDLVVVKNSKYKKVSQRACGGGVGGGVGDITGNSSEQIGAGAAIGGGTANLVDVVSSDGGINNELFVPGCFIEQEKSSQIQSSSWNHSSPSMPVLAPQEPFSTVADNSGKSNHISLSDYDYSQSQINQSSQQQQQPYSNSSDRLQQSPLCMTTSNPQTSQYSASQNEMRPDNIKSPYQHQSSYYQQPSYNGSCYLADNSLSTNASNNQSKTQIHSSPVASLQTTTGSSHIQDYSNYFQNTSQIQSLASSDTASFSSISLTSSSYQQISDHQSSKHTTSKRSSSSRSHQSEQSSSKKRKESSSQPSLQLASYPNNADIYNAAVQNYNFDYYSNGFSDIMGLDRVKLYEQWSNPLNALCPSNIPWNSAMAEYCKQAASLMPQTASSGFGLSANSNPLSLTSNLNPGGSAMDYSNDISHSVDSLKYLDSYAYAMAQPYMYPTFGGIPK